MPGRVRGDTRYSSPRPIGEFQSGDKLGPFVIQKLLGGGAFGTVYQARDPQLGRDVAIKVPKLGLLSEEQKAEFLHEAKVAARVEHPHVCPVYEAETHDGVPCIVMRYVPGTLATYLREQRERGGLSLRSALRFACQLAAGLDATHKRGVIHRDLKPANVLYDTKNPEQEFVARSEPKKPQPTTKTRRRARRWRRWLLFVFAFVVLLVVSLLIASLLDRGAAGPFGPKRTSQLERRPFPIVAPAVCLTCAGIH